ncbi:hypothetical protein [Streptomyces sp. XH2]|uniref:hypothetical protein n=1 Tax=Streptomyces sp. XH2 TaxID=3412483 RepID=UPI003C7B4589
MTAGRPGGGSWALALPMPDQKSSFILTGMAVVLVLLLWWLIRAVARQGGFRRACRRVAWELRVTRRAFAAPFRARSLHRRRVRTLTSFLADPAVPALVDHALADAERAAGEGCRVPAAAVSADRQRVAVVVAGRSPRAATAPWRDARDEPGDWTWSAGAAAVGTGAEAPPARRTLPLVLGVDRLSGATVVADWLCGPPTVSLEGDIRVARSVLQALAAQLDLLAGGPVVQVARGVHPRFPGRELDRILDELETGRSGAGDGDDLPVVLVCWTPSPGQWERLAALCASGRVRALVGGRLPGHCWTLHAEPGGRLLGPGAGVDVESAALSRAVGSAVKKFRRRGTGWWTARDGQVPPTGPGGGDGGGALVPGSGPAEEAGPGDVSAHAPAGGPETGQESRPAGTTPAAQEPEAVPLRGPGNPVPPATAEAAPKTTGTTAPSAPATAPLPGADSALPPAAGSEPAPNTAGTTTPSAPATAPLPGATSTVPPAPPGTTPGTTGQTVLAAPGTAPLPGAGPAIPPPPGTTPGPTGTTAHIPGGPATAPLPGADSVLPPVAGSELGPGTAAAPAAPAPPAGGGSRVPPSAGAEPTRGASAPVPAPAAPEPGPRVGDFAEPEPEPGADAGRGGQPPTATLGPPAPDPDPAPDAGGAVPGTAPAPVPRSWLEPEPEPGSGTGPRPAPGVSAARTHPDRTPEHP